MMGTIYVTRATVKNSEGHFDTERANLRAGAFDAFNQIFSVALAGYPRIREVAQEMEIIDLLHLDSLEAEDFNITVKELENFFKNLQNPTELQNLARRVWEESVVPLVRKDPRFQQG